jgi:1,4-alpha-glucan branching enzyme
MTPEGEPAGRGAEQAAADPVGPGRGAEEPTGLLSLVLHSHMPYVEGFGTYPFGEEWLFDAVLRSYLPVLDVARDVTMTVTPVLADQLEARGAGSRMSAFGRRYRLDSCLADAEEQDGAMRAPCLAEADRYRAALERLDELGGDALEAFRRAQAEGRVELVSSAATHAVLPLIATGAGLRLQIATGRRSHERRFGRSPGFWLPECAYEPGLEEALAEHAIEWFCVDQSAHEPASAALRPVATDAGSVAFPIDWEAVGWLWSLDGYPSDPVHTDFHRESLRGARVWSIGGDLRDPDAGEERAREQGREFLRQVADRLAGAHRGDGPGVLVFAIDTELLGHWWWEGPFWLDEVVRGAAAAGVELTTLSSALERVRPERRELRRASWGEGKDLSTWDSPEVADLAWAARRLELRLLGAVAERELPAAVVKRAARELLALQASDWAFLDKRRQAGDYPYQRVTDHARALLEAIHSGTSPDARLRGLAPDLSLAPLLLPSN